jgi:type I restriction enzyme S subunit
MVTLSQGTLDSIRVPLPPLDRQREIASGLLGVDLASNANVLILNELRRVKSALMSVLLTGEVRVKPDEEAA